jgi:hypothetical protein
LFNKYQHTAQITLNEQKTLKLRSAFNPDGVDFDFTVTRTRHQPKAQAVINLYNINDKSIDLLTQKDPTSKYYNVSKIRCEAGYKGLNKLMFLGTVFNAMTNFPPGEKVTSISVSSYSNQLNSEQFILRYSKPPRISEVLRFLSSGNGDELVFKGNLRLRINADKINPADDKAIAQPCFVGTFTDFINKELTSNPALTCEYYNDTVIVSSLNFKSTRAPIEILSAQNGMIGTPTLTEQNLVKVSALFNPDYTIGGYMQIDSIKFQQPTVRGEIYSLTHTVSVEGATSELEILPDGQAAPFNNIGVAP